MLTVILVSWYSDRWGNHGNGVDGVVTQIKSALLTRVKHWYLTAQRTYRTCVVDRPTQSRLETCHVSSSPKSQIVFPSLSHDPIFLSIFCGLAKRGGHHSGDCHRLFTPRPFDDHLRRAWGFPLSVLILTLIFFLDSHLLSRPGKLPSLHALHALHAHPSSQSQPPRPPLLHRTPHITHHRMP